ncbi:hypothetical protein CHUAL_001678 [Chamberlinius hualienensis]
MASAVDDTSWTQEIKSVLPSSSNANVDNSITNSSPPVDKISSRTETWLKLLGATDYKNLTFDEIFDLPNQEQLRNDCRQFVDKLGNDDEDKLSITSDLESIITYFCKKKHTIYESNNGWLEIMLPLLALKLDKVQLYSCFNEINTRYIPKDCTKNAQIFHLFRLLILYHEPQICSFLDTKRIFPDTFSLSWFRSLFAANCGLEVTESLWDLYFQQSDPTFILFLSLIILINAKEQLLSMAMESQQKIIEMLMSVPGALESDDVIDFWSLATHYQKRTPNSFRIGYSPFMEPSGSITDGTFIASQALCIPVCVEELIHSSKSGFDQDGLESVKFFLVDCRPADQYNSGHLPTAFHLDANLMLQEPQAFATAVKALFSAQKQAISANSLAGGEHLCFMGSGREEEDQYVNMVIASFLQRHCHYVSVAQGGYAALHKLLQSNLSSGLTDHNSKKCIVCNMQNSQPNSSGQEKGGMQKSVSIFDRLSSAVKSKSEEMKEIMIDLISNPNQGIEERHVSSSDKVGKRYRNVSSVFSIDDEHDEPGGVSTDEEDHQEIVSLSTWLKKPDVLSSFKCKEVKRNGHVHPCHLLLTSSHIYVLRTMEDRKDFARIVSRRALSTIVKITSKKKSPELITFKYGIVNGNNVDVNDLDMFHIPRASEATKAVKQQIMKLIDS